MKFGGLLKGYLAWTLAICLWFTSALALGWKMPAFSGIPSGGRSSGGYHPHSSWSFGK
jgi:hypothetical protein